MYVCTCINISLFSSIIQLVPANVFISTWCVHLSLTNRDRNIPSSFHIPSWAKLVGIGLLMGAGLGAIVYYLVKTGRLQKAHSLY